MQDNVRKEVLKLLQEAYDAVKLEDVKRLRDLSNLIIHSAGIYQDEDIIAISVIVYGLSKTYERSDYRSFKDWGKFNQNSLDCLKQAYIHLMNKEDEKYLVVMKRLLVGIDSLGSKLKIYIKEVMQKANINKASRFYEHGVSFGRTARLLGVSPWELMDYIGETGIADVEENLTLDIGRRLKFARELFR